MWRKTGKAPDYRFTLANERTFLAWIRTALAFLAAAVRDRSISAEYCTRSVSRKSCTDTQSVFCQPSLLCLSSLVS